VKILQVGGRGWLGKRSGGLRSVVSCGLGVALPPFATVRLRYGGSQAQDLDVSFELAPHIPGSVVQFAFTIFPLQLPDLHQL
jgi:hypothetical protein